MIPVHLENAVYGLLVTPAVHLADKYGVLAHMLGNGPMTAAGVAADSGLDADTVERMLLVLAASGILRRADDGRYAIPGEVRPYLDPDDPHYIGGFVGHMVGDAAGRIATLEAYLRYGKSAVDAGEPGPYERFYRDAESTREFMAAMWNLSYGISGDLASLAELAGNRCLVDVGGASGPFAVAALKHAPGLRAVVFDLPEAAPYAREAARAHGVADRLDFVAGDFFRDPLPQGDVIALGYVMSNWPDPECSELLGKAYRACEPGGRVLVMERLFDDDRTGPISTAVMNLEMHVETRGRHRTAAEYLDLLAAAGFADGSVRRSDGDKHLIIGHRSPARVRYR
ncbi:hydroxyneurosporene methyltransferase [Spongiactinospora gelatinilytica]|uniref:Hydroxyneurosporene methyltransferase n=2 Tax=Spongiactinospora gelatinilytica TaxID=2666298 RepID=A0A2W2HSG7_9ACTN|nr:hydroxyneurosporene methyltransferase [Spongiactinospora gelatinilytica]